MDLDLELAAQIQHTYTYTNILHYYNTHALYILKTLSSEFSDITYGLGLKSLKLVKQMGNRVTAQSSTLRFGQSLGATHSLHLKGIKVRQLYSNSADTAKRMTGSAALSRPTVGVVNQHLFKGGTAILPDPTSKTISTCSPKCDLSLYQTMKEL